MSILSTNHRLISIGESYSAGNGIDITDQVISVTGDATPYSAGENIDIQDHIISGKDWSKDITEASSHAYNETTAWVKENYANSADMTYISAVIDTKLDASAWSTVSSDYATEDYVIMSDNITYDRAKGYVDSKGYATEEFVNENTSGKLDSTAFTNWQNGQYSTDLQTIEGQISNKLDESAFGEVSGSFLTAAPSDMATTGDVAELAQTISETYQTKGDYLVRSDSANFYPSNNPSGFVTGVDLSNYYTKYETSGKEELANAFANIPAGDTEVNTYVQNNSATINEVNTTYQSNSSNYITAHQSLDGYATTSWVNEQGYLTEVSIPESATWNEVSTTVQTNSAQWGQGGGGSIPVSNSGNLYKVEFDGIDLYGYKSSTTIDSEPVYSSLSSQESTSIQNTESPSWNNAAIDFFSWVPWVGFDVISISSNGSEIYPSDYGNDRITALNVYYKADWLYNNNNNPLPPFSGYIGKITLDNLFISSYIDKPSYFNDIKRCDEFRLWFSGNYYKQDIQNKYICSIGTYVQSEPRTVEGIFVIPNSALPTYEYDSTNKISAINGSALAGGNTEVESYVQNNSATINEVNTTYQANSGNWQDITAYQNASAKYLTGVSHDNTLSGNGTVESPLGVMLSATNDANVNNIVITASLPSTPDANTIYLIPET